MSSIMPIGVLAALISIDTKSFLYWMFVVLTKHASDETDNETSLGRKVEVPVPEHILCSHPFLVLRRHALSHAGRYTQESEDIRVSREYLQRADVGLSQDQHNCPLAHNFTTHPETTRGRKSNGTSEKTVVAIFIVQR